MQMRVQMQSPRSTRKRKRESDDDDNNGNDDPTDATLTTLYKTNKPNKTTLPTVRNVNVNVFNLHAKSCLAPLIATDLIPIILSYSSEIEMMYVNRWSCVGPDWDRSRGWLGECWGLELERDEVIATDYLLGVVQFFNLENGRYLRSINMFAYTQSFLKQHGIDLGFVVDSNVVSNDSNSVSSFNNSANIFRYQQAAQIRDVVTDGECLFVAQLPHIIHVLNLFTLQLVQQWNLKDKLDNEFAPNGLAVRRITHINNNSIGNSNCYSNSGYNNNEIFVSCNDRRVAYVKGRQDQIVSLSKTNGSLNRIIWGKYTSSYPTRPEIPKSLHVDGNDLFACFVENNNVGIIDLGTLEVYKYLNWLNDSLYPLCVDVHGEHLYVILSYAIVVFHRSSGKLLKAYGNRKWNHWSKGNYWSPDGVLVGKLFQEIEEISNPIKLKISHNNMLLVLEAQTTQSISVFV